MEAFEWLREELLELLAGLQGGGGAGGAGDFDPARFWEALELTFQSVSRETRKLTLAVSRQPPPPPSAEVCQRLSDGVRSAVDAAALVYYKLPKSHGETLRRAVCRATIRVVEGVFRVVEVILQAGQQSLSTEQLILAGGIWEACDQVPRLPRDNQAAVALALASSLTLVTDALEEIEQTQVEGGGPPEDMLEDEELGLQGCREEALGVAAEQQLLGPCEGLVKATKAALKKVLEAVRLHGKVDTLEQVGQLDGLAEAAAELSPSVDELVLGVYPPVNPLTLRLNAGKLASVVKEMLEKARLSHICPPSEEHWVQFLAAAVDHNMDKVKGFTQGVL